MKNLLRRLFFGVFNVAQMVLVLWLIVNAPTLFGGMVFEENPHLLDGTPVTGSISQFQPETSIIVIQVYWKASCGACTQQLNMLSALVEELDPHVWGIAVNVRDSDNRAAKAIEANGWENLFHLLGIAGLPQGVDSFPFTEVWVLDVNGDFAPVADWSGYKNGWDEAQQYIDNLRGHVAQEVSE